jgi:thiol-disulfide isomerase/thioredoxin
MSGLAMLLPGAAARAAAPLASLGSRLSGWAWRRGSGGGATVASSSVLGVATGLVWAPCAGPVLALILTGAALRGPGIETSLLLLTYGLGAATALAAGMLLGGRLIAIVRRSLRFGDGPRRVLGAAVIAGTAAIWLGLDTGALTRWSSDATMALEQNLILTLREERPMPERMAQAPTPTTAAPLDALLAARQWLNTPPFQPRDVRGKVVVVNFWTYSCINCLRALPYVRAWAATYRDRGLVVVGVHTPEFAFEKDLGNIGKALRSLGVSYPVAIDSDYAIWRAFDNLAWPALYFIGADGRIRHQVQGEGGYAQSERLIQQLLSEAGGAPAAGELAAISAEGAQAAADPRDLRSPETYIGYGQTRGFASPGGMIQDAASLYRAPPAPSLNQWGLGGVWTVGEEFATAGAPSGGITCRFHARDLHLVLAPATPGRGVRFRVRIDGAAPGADHGADVDADGWGTVRDGRLYQLVRQTGPVADRTFQIEFLDPGVRAYAFTFG